MPIRFLARLAVVLSAIGFVFAASHAGLAQAGAIKAEDPIQNLGQWESALQADLIAEKFEGLDSTADHLRAEKTHLPGGEWQLRVFYTALDAPQQSEKDSSEHIAHLEHWMSQRPTSITARVALATALTRWAWVARGNGMGNTVTPEGWRLFGERIKEAQVILDGSAKMPTMCPQWYSAMLTVGTAQGWDTKRMHEILEDGTKFEPGYYYLYLQYANYLLPKWHGRPGDSSSFAASSADAVGGDAGDILYFQIATNLIKRGDAEFPIHEMDWQRIQRGYQALISQYGPAKRPENELAFMAWKFQDAAVARRQFALIGENWGRAIWRDRNYFDRARDWAQAPTPGLMPGQESGLSHPVQ
jgi:hypothetical protein